MPHAFAPEAVQAVYRAIFERRDMRHFSGGTVASDTLRRLLNAAHHAPSVGFMQPWRFIRITDPALRQQLHIVVEAERLVTARVMGEREDEFMRLKVEGLLDAAEVLGMGWVSLFDPAEVARLLGLPEGAEPIALLCLGPVEQFYPEPMLQQANWAKRQPLDSLVFENQWGEASDLFEVPTASVSIATI